MPLFCARIGRASVVLRRDHIVISVIVVVVIVVIVIMVNG